MLSEYLKENCRASHDSIEKAIDLMVFAEDPHHYQSLLKAFHGYYVDLEPKLFNFKDEFLELGIDIDQRLKISLLKDDLETFEVSDREIKSLNKCSNLPSVNNIYEAMGVLYVLEGSTLGAQIIFKQLLKYRVLKEDGIGGSFFRPYGKETMSMWLALRESLNSLPENKSETILLTAKKTFKTLEDWLVENLRIH